MGFDKILKTLFHVSMEVTIRERDGVGILAINGEIDLYNARELSEAIEKIMSEGKNRVIIDFAEASYIDSTGIGALLGANGKLKAAGGGIRFMKIPEPVNKVFRLSNLSAFIPCHDSEDEAVQAFS